MAGRADTTAYVRRLQRAQILPVVPDVYSGDTRLVARWRNDPFEFNLPALEHHIVSATYTGSGGASVKMGSQVVSGFAQTGSITLWPSGHDGYWRVEQPIEVSNIFLGRARLQGCADEIGDGREPDLTDRVNHPDPKLFAIMALINDEVTSADAISHLYVEQLLDVLCLQLIRAHSQSNGTLATGPKGGLAGWQVRRVTTYMRENLAEDIRVQELADLVNLSRFHFSSAFRAATGQSPYGWLTSQRVGYAKRLLRDRKLSIADVAAIVGYETQSAFSVSFKKVTGITPREFRLKL